MSIESKVTYNNHKPITFPSLRISKGGSIALFWDRHSAVILNVGEKAAFFVGECTTAVKVEDWEEFMNEIVLKNKV